MKGKIFILVLGLLLPAPGLLAQVPISGAPAPTLAALDTAILNLMSQWHIPGAALAITRNGSLVFAHGYGYGDTESQQPVQPDSLFRIASISKPFTAAATLKLIEQNKFTLNTPAFSLLADLTPAPGAVVDPRLSQITIRHLLEHTAGWDRDIAGDPPFQYAVTAAEAFGAAPPASPDLLIRYMMGKPLQHNPGATYAYSNFGYIVLGAIIQRASAQSYASFVQSFIQIPAGIYRMQPGNSLLAGRQTDEVKYYDYPGAPLSSSIFPPVGSSVPSVYGGFSVELMLANGGWIADTMDLLRFADNINGQLTPAILQSPPGGFVGYVPPVGAGWGWNFYGSLPGTSTVLHLDTGFQMTGKTTFAILFNTRQSGVPSPDILADADGRILQAVNGIQSWPSVDLFPTYSGPNSSCSFTLSSNADGPGSGSGSGSVGVTVTNNCAWTAVSDSSSWLTVTGGSPGVGGGTASYSFTANPDAGSRVGKLTIADKTFTVTQAGAPPSPCDINADLSINVADVQLILNEALGVTQASHDLNHDSVVNVVDLQKTVNGALGLACPA